MKTNSVIKTLAASMMLAAASTAMAGVPKVAMLIGSESETGNSDQEDTAIAWFKATYPGALVITPSNIDALNENGLEAVWVHIDRNGIQKGLNGLPEAFRNEDTLDALNEFVADGGSVYLSKLATQLLPSLGRIPASYIPLIYQGDCTGAGDAGNPADPNCVQDDWCINAHLGSWQINPGNANQDPTQIYDRRSHEIWTGLSTRAAGEGNDFPHESFPIIGSGNNMTGVYREDHNCCWDLNAYSDAFKPVDGESYKNTLEKFEATQGCTVLGTWGHVQDYCVAGIVDFAPKGSIKGRILANGLAAYQFNTQNAYHSNVTRLTSNILGYLAPSAAKTAIDAVGVDAAPQGAPVYYTLQGVQVANPAAGLYIKVAGGKATKVVLK